MSEDATPTPDVGSTVAHERIRRPMIETDLGGWEQRRCGGGGGRSGADGLHLGRRSARSSMSRYVQRCCRPRAPVLERRILEHIYS